METAQPNCDCETCEISGTDCSALPYLAGGEWNETNLVSSNQVTKQPHLARESEHPTNKMHSKSTIIEEKKAN